MNRGYTIPAVVLAIIPLAADVARYVSIPDLPGQSGQLISFVDNHYELSGKEYDSNLVGVINTDPSVAINTVGHDSTFPIIDSGNGSVLVNSSNGSIAVGDALTSSKQPGIAMKAGRPGLIVGRALEPYSSNDPNASQAINAMLLFKWADIQNMLSPDRPLTKELMDRIGYGFRLSTIAALDEPSTALRFILAILVLLFSFISGFLVFGRVASNGVYAIGRNPLARHSINFAIMINVLITVAITASGLVVAVLILTF